MSRLVFAALLCAVLASQGTAQVVAAIPDSNPTIGGGNIFPFSIAPYTSIHCYYASQLRAQGVCGGAILTDFEIAAASTSALYTLTNGQIHIGHLAVSPPIAGTWLTALVAPTVVWDTAISGPLSFAATASTWVSIPGFSTAGFVWDGTSDIAVHVTSATGGFTGGFQVRSSNTNIRYGTSTFMATNQAPTTTGILAMKARFTFLGGFPQFQVNQPASSLDIDGVVGQPCAPAIVTKCTGSAGSINFASTLPSAPYEVVVDPFASLLPAGGGGIALPASGQFVNINAASPNLIFVNNFSFPLFPGNFSIPFTSTPPLQLSAQQVLLNPTNPDGVSLSAGATLIASAGGSIAGPVTDNLALSVTLGVSPLCGPASITHYGTTYTQIFVSTNGRITFGAANTIATPATALAAAATPPSINVWADYNQALGGNVVVSAPNATTLRVDYTSVPYAGQPTTANTFAIEFDTLTNSIRLDGLTGLQVHPVGTLNSFVGVSRGAGATDPGQALFSSSPAGVSVNSTDMMYAFGPAGTLTTGLNGILFMPNAFPSYDWITY